MAGVGVGGAGVGSAGGVGTGVGGAGVGGGVPHAVSSQDVHWQSCSGVDTGCATHLPKSHCCSGTQDCDV